MTTIRLPTKADALRRRALRRDSFQCTRVQRGTRCPERATQVIGHAVDNSATGLASRCDQHA